MEFYIHLFSIFFIVFEFQSLFKGDIEVDTVEDVQKNKYLILIDAAYFIWTIMGIVYSPFRLLFVALILLSIFDISKRYRILDFIISLTLLFIILGMVFLL